MEVREILSKKGNDVYSITPESTVFEAIEKMAELEVGALLVMKDGKLNGIISERDYRIKVVLKGRTSRETKVKEIMASDVITISPGDSVEDCMGLMTDKRIRHLPVLENEKVIGVISIGDIVKSIIDKQKEEIEDLKGYISGSYPG